MEMFIMLEVTSLLFADDVVLLAAPPKQVWGH